jgi:AraC family transcriptional regulator
MSDVMVMSDLVASEFPSEAKAEEVRQKLLNMRNEYLIKLGDAGIAMTEISVPERNLDPAPSPDADQLAVVAGRVPNQTRLLVILGKLLQGAGRALDCDRDVAKDFIARAASLLESKLGHLSEESASAKSFRGGLAPWQVCRVKAHIEASLASARRVRDLFRITNLSRSYFCRAFKRSFGETPHAYIARRRIERAQEMMLTTDEPLSQIALACGLYDQAEWRRGWAGNSG